MQREFDHPLFSVPLKNCKPPSTSEWPGGDWDQYHAALEEFAVQMKERNVKVRNAHGVLGRFFRFSEKTE